MNTLERNWWEALADQYEVWAENPPTWIDLLNRRHEDWTCDALFVRKWGWNPREIHKTDPCESLMPIWVEEYGFDAMPAGYVYSRDRDAKRYEFCIWMAERIRREL